MAGRSSRGRERMGGGLRMEPLFDWDVVLDICSNSFQALGSCYLWRRRRRPRQAAQLRFARKTLAVF